MSGTQVYVYGTHAYTTGAQFKPVVTLTYLPTNASITATSTVDVAADVTSQTTTRKTAPGRIVSRSSPYYGLYTSTLTVENTSSRAIPGALEIVLTGLSGATLEAATLELDGRTYMLSVSYDSAGDPYSYIPRSLLADLPSGSSVAVSLYFSDPLATAIAYGTNVYSDPFDD